MLTDDNWQTVIKQRAKYQDIMKMSRALWSELRVPLSSTHGILEGFEPLIPPVANAFWSGHSDRTTVNSWAAELGFTKEDRDRLGRWAPEQSDDYLRSSKVVIHKIQQSVASAIRSNDASLVEEETLQGLAVFLRERNEVDSEIDKIVDTLEARELFKDPIQGSVDDIVEEDKDDGLADTVFDFPDAINAQEVTQEELPFWINIGRRKQVRKLHMLAQARGGSVVL